MAKKGFFKWIWENVILAFAVAVGLDVIVKTQWPKLLSEFTSMLGSTIKGKVDNDKRAEMLREFRRMEIDDKINIDNLNRRYKNSIKNRPVSEYLFVELICKIPPADPNDPLSIRQTVTPGAAGVPQNDRQADLKWLNDMPDARFYQMLEFLNHNVISQWWRIAYDHAVLILKWIYTGLKAAIVTVLAGLGIVGVSVLSIPDVLWNDIRRFFRWMNASWLRVAVVAVLSLPVILLGALAIGPIRRKLFAFLCLSTVLSILGITYLSLVQKGVGAEMFFVIVMSTTALIVFWKSARLRGLLILLVVGLCVIWSLRVLQHSDGFTKKVQAAVARRQESDTQRQKPSLSQSPPIPSVPWPARPRKNKALSESNTSTTVEGVASTQVLAKSESETLTAAQTEYLPISGNQGDIHVALTECRYVGVGSNIECRGYFEETQGLETSRIRLCDSSGEYEVNGSDGNTFNVWLSDNSVQFRGGGYMKDLIPGVKTGFYFHFRAPNDVTDLGIILVTGDGKGNFFKSTFTRIPVSLN